VGENSGSILSRLRIEVYEILGRRSGPLVLSNTLTRLFMLFHSKDIRHCLRSRRKVNKCESFYGPHFWGGTIQTFYSILFAQFIVHRLAKLFKFRFIDVYFYGSVY